MILSLIWTGLGKLRLYAAAALAGVVLLLTLQAKWRKEGRDQARLKTLEETNRRVAKGAAGAQQAREAQNQGRTPQAGVDSRNGDWK